MLDGRQDGKTRVKQYANKCTYTAFKVDHLIK